MKNDDKDKKDEKLVDEHEGKAEDKNEVEQEIEVLKKKVEECENSYRRALADYQNLQKRVTAERQDWVRSANKELLLRLLPILDTLMLAHKHSGTEELKVGINQFIDTLKAEGVTKVETAGRDFDPQTMDAVEVIEGEDGKVIEEVKSGFMIYDKLLRPAYVKVGRGK